MKGAFPRQLSPSTQKDEPVQGPGSTLGDDKVDDEQHPGTKMKWVRTRGATFSGTPTDDRCRGRDPNLPKIQLVLYPESFSAKGAGKITLQLRGLWKNL